MLGTAKLLGGCKTVITAHWVIKK